MGLCKFVKRMVLYGGITVAGLYAMASCQHKPEAQPSRLERVADEGLKQVQTGIGAGHKGLDYLDKRVNDAREYLNVEERK
ncbi:hypothetical protein HY493_02485 [Candidatus Woesearchaeota archaeon]|nr:hypothetical protein [Candidatus Woesearchaeota archaeon]